SLKLSLAAVASTTEETLTGICLVIFTSFNLVIWPPPF
ncbi:MAG: hypothetical protein ACI94O_002459, partial [Octadecabacter sp.]